MNDLTLLQAIEKLKNKDISSNELTLACLNRIKATEPKINALITLCEEQAIKEAELADSQGFSNEEKPLLGIPFVIKDNFCTKEVKTTAASKMLDNFVPAYDSTVVSKLKDAGAIVLAKANMDAWAHGSSTETSEYGCSKNPWNTDFLPGGSSGGTAASIASDQAIIGIGSETAGSIRQPAAWCGVVGLKPTYGRVSRFGVVAMASSLDSPGPITKNVKDAAFLLKIIAGKDEKDATTSKSDVQDYVKALGVKLNGMTIGIPFDYFEGVDSEVTKKVNDVIGVYKGMGVNIKDISLFAPKYAVSVYTIIQRAEVSSNLARYDGIRYGVLGRKFGEEATRRIMTGTFVLSAGYYDQYYNKAIKVRTKIIEDFNKAFEKVDIILGPTTPTAALPVGATKNQDMFGELADMLVEPSSIAGLCGISVPCGFTSNGLPVGFQLIGKQFDEGNLLNFAYQYEQETQFFKEKPKL